MQNKEQQMAHNRLNRLTQKQTAVEWLWRWIMDNPFGSFQDGLNAYNQAKEMEKQQIIDAISNANKSNNRNVSLNPEQYYNETFEKK